jgi:hypothetical protein
MKKNSSLYSLLLILVSLIVICRSTAFGRIYPPCQAISYTVDIATVSYSYVDPISGVNNGDSWTLPSADERLIVSPITDQGILTWIAKYKNSVDAYYTYEVHYRIYDPTRGGWRNGSWGPFTGYGTWIDQLTVKDGVVAWRAVRRLGANPADTAEWYVLCATYNPRFGSWSLGQHMNRAVYPSNWSPEVLRVKNGVVAWPECDQVSGTCSDEQGVRIGLATYDAELGQWISRYSDAGPIGTGFDWIQIKDDTVQVEIQSAAAGNYTVWSEYDAYNHTWVEHNDPRADRPIPIRRAYFVAQPNEGFVPFWVWFWDCSTALEPPNVSYSWAIAQGVTKTDRSPGFRYTTAASEFVLELVSYGSQLYQASTWIEAKPPAPPPGEISINNGDTYTNSTHVTLNLKHGFSAFQMCFRQTPGLLVWTSWELVAPTKDWTLSTKYVGGSPDGPHSVSVKFRDLYGTESTVSQASIILDITPPAGTLTLNGGAATTKNPDVQTTWSADLDTSGVAKMSWCSFNEEDTHYHWSLWENYQATSRQILFSSHPGRKTVIVRFMDNAGNVNQIEASIYLGSLIFLPTILKD